MSNYERAEAMEMMQDEMDDLREDKARLNKSNNSLRSKLMFIREVLDAGPINGFAVRKIREVCGVDPSEAPEAGKNSISGD